MLDIRVEQTQKDAARNAATADTKGAGKTGEITKIAGATDISTDFPPMTVLVIDDHRLVRAALTQVLHMQAGIKQFAVARDYSEGAVLAHRFKPDIIWLDLHITHDQIHHNNRREIHHLKQISPQSRILAITGVEDEQEAFEAIMGGAQGYRSKQDVDPDEIMTLIQALYQGEFVLRPALLTQLMHRLRTAAMPTWHAGQHGNDPNALPKLAGASGLSLLTAREREVLQLIIQGQRDRNIAEQLHIAEKTVQKHVQGILNKLGVQNRTEAAYLIFNQGIYHS